MAAEGAAKMADSNYNNNNNNNNDKTKSTTGKRKHQHDNDVKGNRISNDKNEDRGEEKKQKKKSKSSSSEEKQDKQSNSNAHAHAWLYRDIIVRIVAKNMEGGKYFRKKAIVDKVLDDTYTAEVEILNDNGNNNGNGNSNGGGGGDILRLDQNDLETVIPKMKKSSNNNDNKVRILKGKYRGSKAIIQNLDKVNYHADLKIIKLKVQKQNNDGVVKLKVKGKEDDVGMILKNVQYEDFSQIA